MAQDQSVVIAGPLAGTTLGDLVRRHGAELLGDHAPLKQFPLLFKFLDAQKDLSVQVHPNDQQAAQLVPPDRGKTEAWIVLHAEPGSRIYAGLQPGVDRAALERAVADGTADACLHCVPAQVGDCLLIPAGTVHAIGAGLVIAEIQQSSDTTYRLYDWNRVGPDGQPRELHVAAALEVTDFERGPVNPLITIPAAEANVTPLARCDKFVVDRRQSALPLTIGGDSRCHLLVPESGSVSLAGDPTHAPLEPGQTALIPAAAGTCRVTPDGQATLLDIYLPAV